jgi:hypothetical protein
MEMIEKKNNKSLFHSFDDFHFKIEIKNTSLKRKNETSEGKILDEF